MKQVASSAFNNDDIASMEKTKEPHASLSNVFWRPVKGVQEQITWTKQALKALSNSQQSKWCCIIRWRGIVGNNWSSQASQLSITKSVLKLTSIHVHKQPVINLRTPQPKKAEAIDRRLPPASRKQLRHFLGMVNYCGDPLLRDCLRIPAAPISHCAKLETKPPTQTNDSQF